MNAAERRALERVRRLCLSLPEVSERLSHGEITWFIRDKRVLAMMDDHHHGGEHYGITIPAHPGIQQDLIAEDPSTYYRPAYVGPSGWVGVYLDESPDWDLLERLIEDAYRLKAPKTLVKQLDA